MKPMKLFVRLLFAGTSLFLLAASTYAQTGNTCPSPGTEVPFAKVINPAFASDYVGCDITVKVQFLTSSPSPFHWDYVKGTSGKVPFQVVVPGEQLSSGPMGIPPQPHVFLPKDKSEVIFSLKTGDQIFLRGALGPAPVASVMGRKLKIGGWPPAFIASDLISAKASDAAIKEMTQRRGVRRLLEDSGREVDHISNLNVLRSGNPRPCQKGVCDISRGGIASAPIRSQACLLHSKHRWGNGCEGMEGFTAWKERRPSGTSDFPRDYEWRKEWRKL